MPDVSARAVSATVSGRVQGVGFRWSAATEAGRRGLAGWVRNCLDGTVEVFAQGDAAAVGGFVDWLHDGPRGARVAAVDVTELSPDPALRDFTIR